VRVQIPFPLVGRLWDTYLSEGDAFPEYLVYVSASFLLTVSLFPKLDDLFADWGICDVYN
jgi:hypothetical protein